MGHVENRAIIVEAWQRVIGPAPTLFEARTMHALAELETDFGEGWKAAGVDSNNIGADQAPGCPLDSFAYVDTHPNPDGTSSEYKVCFRSYASKLLGAVGMIRISVLQRPEVRKALLKGSELAFSAAMWTSVYYEGFGRDEDDRIVNHYLAIIAHAQIISAALGEPSPVGAKLLVLDTGKAVLRFGSTGSLVKEWQRIVRVAADGIFGKVTEEATKLWQLAHGLKVDGIVGVRTWGLVSPA